jgi:2-C-methyl-D-erythritol 4-phosphate cytidylyltransferase
VSFPRIHALIPAAGLSVRFGGTTLKQYAHLQGKPVIAHSIEAVRQHDSVAAVTVALAQDDGIYDELIRPQYPEVHTVTGGDSRARTVLNGLRFIRSLDAECHWVLVHDAARPCLSYAALEALLRLGLKDEYGAILAVPVSDTLKRETGAGRIECTVARSGLWVAQTPQLFPLNTLLEHLQAAVTFGIPPTDEAEAMERAGIHPLLVPGCAENIKITGPEDLTLAEIILKHRIETGQSP